MRMRESVAATGTAADHPVAHPLHLRAPRCSGSAGRQHHRQCPRAARQQLWMPRARAPSAGSRGGRSCRRSYPLHQGRPEVFARHLFFHSPTTSPSATTAKSASSSRCQCAALQRWRLPRQQWPRHCQDLLAALQPPYQALAAAGSAAAAGGWQSLHLQRLFLRAAAAPPPLAQSTSPPPSPRHTNRRRAVPPHSRPTATRAALPSPMRQHSALA